MAERKLTLFEIHLDDARFSATANAPGADPSLPDVDDGDDAGDGDETDDADGCGCPAKRAAKPLLVLGLLGGLAALALLAAKRLGGESLDEDLESLADLDAE